MAERSRIAGCYARVSTADQDATGQIDELRRYCQDRGLDVDRICGSGGERRPGAPARTYVTARAAQGWGGYREVRPTRVAIFSALQPSSNRRAITCRLASYLRSIGRRRRFRFICSAPFECGEESGHKWTFGRFGLQIAHVPDCLRNPEPAPPSDCTRLVVPLTKREMDQPSILPCRGSDGAARKRFAATARLIAQEG